MSNIFNPLSNIFIKLSFILKHTSAKFIKTQAATTRLVSMMEDLANEKRQKILNGDMKNLPDQEKDLLTMMIEADIEEGTETTTTQLRVSSLYAKLFWNEMLIKIYSKTLPSSFWLVMIQLQMQFLFVYTILQRIQMYNKNYVTRLIVFWVMIL